LGDFIRVPDGRNGSAGHRESVCPP
jgi:hypothetical protein